MLRTIGYVIARRDLDGPDGRQDWALLIESLFRRLAVGLGQELQTSRLSKRYI
ncbi:MULTISPECIES: hypothetical protein [unclassified Rhizobium]|uniref:hypothetical protein n=1 Tax=unclassified Rhizobium TaxID=2613769 RepID=UPI0012E36461|nr:MULTISPECIES: hypothetical protein [unclassified Rhizobium]